MLVQSGESPCEEKTGNRLFFLLEMDSICICEVGLALHDIEEVIEGHQVVVAGQIAVFSDSAA